MLLIMTRRLHYAFPRQHDAQPGNQDYLKMKNCATVVSGRPRNADLEARSDSLLGTASALFIKQGYSGTSLEMIAREGRVAVRTIYIKFGGKAGLLAALLARRRERYAAHVRDLVSDTRPLTAVLTEFGMRLLDLIATQESIALQRMVISESPNNPELAETAYQSGIGQTYAVLAQFFERADIRAQLRHDVALKQLPSLLVSCVIGDPLHHFIFGPEQLCPAKREQALAGRIDLFIRGVLR